MTMTNERCPKCDGMVIVIGGNRVCIECSYRLDEELSHGISGASTVIESNTMAPCPYAPWTIYCSAMGAGCMKCPLKQAYE